MTPQDRTRMYELCRQIEAEQDHVKFLQLVKELHDLLCRVSDPPQTTNSAPQS